MNLRHELLTGREGFPPSLMPCGGRALTIPHQSVNISDAITRYSAPTIAQQLRGYYDEEGYEMPDFDRLDKVECLQLLAEAKANMQAAKEKAKNLEADAIAKAEKVKAANVIPQQSKPSNNEDGK